MSVPTDLQSAIEDLAAKDAEYSAAAAQVAPLHQARSAALAKAQQLFTSHFPAVPAQPAAK